MTSNEPQLSGHGGPPLHAPLGRTLVRQGIGHYVDSHAKCLFALFRGIIVDMGIFQTRSVKVPLMKVAFAGMTIAGFYWSWLQILSGATPTLLDSLLYAAAGLVVSVLIAYFMNFLARVPKLGYDQ